MNAKDISDYRVFPRLFSFFYLFLGYEVTTWMMLLDNPSNAQAGFATMFATTVVGWFKYYVEGGK